MAEAPTSTSIEDCLDLLQARLNYLKMNFRTSTDIENSKSETMQHKEPAQKQIIFFDQKISKRGEKNQTQKARS